MFCADIFKDLEQFLHLKQLSYAQFLCKITSVTFFNICAKNSFYCVNTSYPMDNSLSDRRRPARQTSEKGVLCFHRLAGP